MTTTDYKKEIVKELHNVDKAMARMLELFELCEWHIIDEETYAGLEELHNWFSEGYPFDKSFDELVYEVGSWGYVLEESIEEGEK